jgi:DHA1 family bicyclomycin/chloramphenicol resistance-like MFS transporter
MKNQPASASLTLLLGGLAAVPYSGIDINLPALSATAAALRVGPSNVGLTISAFMLSLALAPLIYGPVSDRVGRKPTLVFGLTLFVAASLACACSQSLKMLLAFRFFQGAGAACTTLTFAIARDLFDEMTARAKIANIVIAINVVTVIAPSAGAAVLAIGDWRLIYVVQASAGVVLLAIVVVGFSESAKLCHGSELLPSTIIRDYIRFATDRVSVVFTLVGAAGGATVFAYVTGSSLFFVGVVGLRPGQYAIIFSACSAAVMCGAIIDGRLGRWGALPAKTMTVGLGLLFASSSAMLALTLAGFSSTAAFATLLMIVALAFGISLPNIINATMQSLPDIAGTVGAAAGSIQMICGSGASSLVAVFFDGRSALSMVAVMAISSLLALSLYLMAPIPAPPRLP